MFSVAVFLLGIVCFNSIQAIDYIDMADKFDAEDIDELTRIAWRCTWLIMCDFHKIFEIKTIINEVKPETVYFFLSELRKLYPEKEKDVTDEEVFQDDFWKTRAEGIACSLTQEERDRLSSVNLTDYMIEKCEDEEISEECERLTYAVDKNKDVMEKYKEQCMEIISKEQEEGLEQKMSF
ncbi:uncharacterized protein TNCV_2392391 [Trichonephila clavipes]|nr:uncharacterized protein TNCV_2392391 [Trichonephila clavipes]